jgi:predicted Zn-dependent protease
MTLAKASDRPNLAWTFIVLDTDGVNAFASPGGLVHVTRGALGLVKNEAELAAVLAHEIGHVTRKHTVNAIQKNKLVQAGTDKTLSGRAPFLDQMANKAYEIVLENSFDRGDELDADRVSVSLTQKVGYAPTTLGDFLARLDDRNKSESSRNGLFASHPETKERIDKIKQLSAGAKATALVEARYKSNIKYQATAITSIATVTEGSAGLAGSSNSGKDDKSADNKEEPKKKGFGLDSLKTTVAPEKKSEQVSASGGARGLGADRAAKGGGNPALVKVAVSADELATFKMGIA